MKEKNKGAILTQNQYEKEEHARKKIMDFYTARQMSPEAAIFTLRLLGFSATRAKEILKQWRDMETQ